MKRMNPARPTGGAVHGTEAAPLRADAPEEETPAEPRTLSAEEQMARFEKELKESDWGHQPC